MGRCDLFLRLPEKINSSQFLTPRLSHESLRKAIVQPALKFGVRFDEILIAQILNDVGHNQDHLPLLQHALARTWEIASDKGPIETLTLEDYHHPEVGGIQNALQIHADEVFDGLGDGDPKRGRPFTARSGVHVSLPFQSFR